MYRHARAHAPGSTVHLISRFVNREYRIAGDTERAAFLTRIPGALERADWRLLAYALMSSHIHLSMVAGEAPPWQFLKPLHIGFARWINRAHGRLGPVFADRPTSVEMGSERTAVLLAYLHNNPVRARVIPLPSQCTWTSHRCYLGLERAPRWLAVEEGLRRAGFDGSESGRRGFDEYVCARLAEPRDAALSGAVLPAVRKRLRAGLALPIETGALQVGSALSTDIMYKGASPVVPRWSGELEALLGLVAGATGTTVAELCSRSRERRVAGARRLALVVGCRILRRDVQEVAAAMTLSSSAASHLLRDGRRLFDQAQELATALMA